MVRWSNEINIPRLVRVLLLGECRQDVEQKYRSIIRPVVQLLDARSVKDRAQKWRDSLLSRLIDSSMSPKIA